eukprot:6194682-Pleurochrysis_carterae.AAC.1
MHACTISHFQPAPHAYSRSSRAPLPRLLIVACTWRRHRPLAPSKTRSHRVGALSHRTRECSPTTFSRSIVY